MSWTISRNYYSQKVGKYSGMVFGYICEDIYDPTTIGFAGAAEGFTFGTLPDKTPTADYYIDGTYMGSADLTYRMTVDSTVCYADYAGSSTTGGIAAPDEPSVTYSVSAAYTHTWKIIVHYGSYYSHEFSGTITYNYAYARVSYDALFGKVGEPYGYTITNMYPCFTYKVHFQVRGASDYETVKTIDQTAAKGSWTATIAEVVERARAYGATRANIKIIIESFTDGTSFGSSSTTGYLYYPDVSATFGDLVAGHSGTITLEGDSCVTSGSYLHVLYYGSTEVGRWTGSGEKSYVPDLETFAPLITSATGKSFSFTLKAYTGTTVSDSYLINSASISGYVSLESDDVCPQPTLTLTDASGIFQTLGKYLVGNSYLNGSVSDGLRYGATVKSRRTDINNTYYTAASFTTEVIENAYVTTVTVSVTDSRGLTGYAEYTIAICDWHVPALPTAAIHRGYYVDGVWTANDNGNYVKIDWGIDVSPVENTNTKALTITAPDGTHSITPSAYDSTGALYSEASTEKSYDIVIMIADSYASLTRTLRLSTAGVVLDIKSGGKGIGIGKVAETDGVVDISSDWDVYVHGMTLKEYIQAVVAGTV